VLADAFHDPVQVGLIEDTLEFQQLEQAAVRCEDGLVRFDGRSLV